MGKSTNIGAAHDLDAEIAGIRPDESPLGLVTDSKVTNDDLLGDADAAANDWRVIVVKSRIDSFSQRALVEEIRTLRELGHKKIALDLKANRFLSLPMIKHCVDVADKVASEGGAFALISCPEKTKRHFEIYGSLDHIGVVRSAAELAAPTKPNRK